jgi:hypothetical protein
MIFSQSLTKPYSFSQHHRRCFPVPMPQPMVVTTVWHSPDISSLVESIYLGPSSVQSDSCGRFGGNSSVVGSSIIGCFACGVVSFCTFLLLCKDGLLLSTAQQPVNMVLFIESNPLNREMTISFVTRLRWRGSSSDLCYADSAFTTVRYQIVHRSSSVGIFMWGNGKRQLPTCQQFQSQVESLVQRRMLRFLCNIRR